MSVLDDIHYEPSKEAFFQCGAEDLAHRLLGHYLYCSQSNMLVRIVETEAYPNGMLQRAIQQLKERSPDKFEKIFEPEPEPESWLSPKSEYESESESEAEAEAEAEVEAEADPEVPVEEPEYVNLIQERRGFKTLTDLLRKDLLINPTLVAKALGDDWKSNPNLYEEGGVQLLLKKAPLLNIFDGNVPDPREPYSEGIVHGPRVLPKAKYVQECLYAGGGRELKLRFALDTSMGYHYAHNEGETKAQLEAVPKL